MVPKQPSLGGLDPLDFLHKNILLSTTIYNKILSYITGIYKLFAFILFCKIFLKKKKKIYALTK